MDAVEYVFEPIFFARSPALSALRSYMFLFRRNDENLGTRIHDLRHPDCSM